MDCSLDVVYNLFEVILCHVVAPFVGRFACIYEVFEGHI